MPCFSASAHSAQSSLCLLVLQFLVVAVFEDFDNIKVILAIDVRDKHFSVRFQSDHRAYVAVTQHRALVALVVELPVQPLLETGLQAVIAGVENEPIAVPVESFTPAAHDQNFIVRDLRH